MDVAFGALRALPRDTFLRAIPIAMVAAVLIGIPADIIDTRFFGRPVAVRPLDYVILAVTASLIGVILAIRADGLEEPQDNRTVLGGFVSFLAVGCPVCNQAVVALVGVSGALSWWAPIQPLIGLAAIGLLLWALQRRLRTYSLVACPVA